MSDEQQLLFELNCLQRSSARKRFRKDIFEAWEHRCAYCDRKDPSTLDHVIPRAKGGPTTRNNLVAACADCNLQKSDSDYFTWWRSQEFWCEERELKVLQWIYEDPIKTEAAKAYEDLRRLNILKPAD